VFLSSRVSYFGWPTSIFVYLCSFHSPCISLLPKCCISCACYVTFVQIPEHLRALCIGCLFCLLAQWHSDTSLWHQSWWKIRTRKLVSLVGHSAQYQLYEGLLYEGLWLPVRIIWYITPLIQTHSYWIPRVWKPAGVTGRVHQGMGLGSQICTWGYEFGFSKKKLT
jgi:hypothetical protein